MVWKEHSFSRTACNDCSILFVPAALFIFYFLFLSSLLLFVILSHISSFPFLQCHELVKKGSSLKRTTNHLPSKTGDKPPAVRAPTQSKTPVGWTSAVVCLSACIDNGSGHLLPLLQDSHVSHHLTHQLGWLAMVVARWRISKRSQPELTGSMAALETYGSPNRGRWGCHPSPISFPATSLASLSGGQPGFSSYVAFWKTSFSFLVSNQLS